MRTAIITAILVLTLVWLVGFAEATPMGTVFTYQGRLMDLDQPANGLYDFLFKIYNEPNGVGYNIPSNNLNDIDVIDGYFTVELDFGSNVFNGNAKWLEVSVRPGDSNDFGDYVALSPRQEVTPTPYALQARGIFVDSEENVGIGTTNPESKMHIEQSIGAWDEGIRLSYEGHKWDIVTDYGGERLNIIRDQNSTEGVVIRNGNVGIGTRTPSEKLHVRGNIDVASNQIKRYYGFPRPNYDSGWVPINTGETITLTHGCGGNVDNYVVDLQCKHRGLDPKTGINSIPYGEYYDSGLQSGVWYLNLETNTIQIQRSAHDGNANEMRIRIWVYN